MSASFISGLLASISSRARKMLAASGRDAAPTSPARRTEVPMADSTGIIRSITAASPPTMIASCPVFARGTPPDTGASIITPPSAATFSARAWVCEGTPELISIITVPGFMPAKMLSSPALSTRSTIALVGNMVTITSDAPASCASVSGAVPPICCTKLFATSCRASATFTVKPALTRQAAIGQPMLPTPTKTTVGLSVIVCIRTG